MSVCSSWVVLQWHLRHGEDIPSFSWEGNISVVEGKWTCYITVSSVSLITTERVYRAHRNWTLSYCRPLVARSGKHTCLWHFLLLAWKLEIDYVLLCGIHWEVRGQGQTLPSDWSGGILHKQRRQIYNVDLLLQNRSDSTEYSFNVLHLNVDSEFMNDKGR